MSSRIKKNCPICNDEFYTFKSQNNLTCSKKCGSRYRSIKSATQKHIHGTMVNSFKPLMFNARY